MNQIWVKRRLYILILNGFFFPSLYAQTWYLSPAASRIIISHCAVCLRHPAGAAQIRSSGEGNEVEKNYHHCHISLQHNDLNNGFQYATRTIAAIKNDPDNPVLLCARFLKARIFYYKNLYDEALPEYLALIRMKHLDVPIVASIYTNLGGIFTEQQEYTTALQYLKAWEHKFLSLTEPYTVRRNYSNMGVCYLHLKRFREADDYFQKSISIAAQQKDTLGLARIYSNIANNYYEQHYDDKAIVLFKKALLFATYSHNSEDQINAYENIAVIEENRKRYRIALQYRIKYDSLSRIKWNNESIWQLAALDKKLAVEAQEHTLQLARQQNKLQVVELSKRNWQRNTLLILAILFLSFAAFISQAYRQKAKRNRIIDAQREELNLLNQTKDQLFSIISHDLRTLVYTLKITLSRLSLALAQNQLRDAAALAESTEKISSSTYALLNNLLHWALTQTGQLSYKPETINAKEVAAQVCSDLLPVAAAKNIHLQDNTQNDVYFTADINSVKIILRNLVDNAIKYTPGHGNVTICATPCNHLCQITVQDTGVGMEQTMAAGIMNNGARQIQKDTDGNRSTGLGLWLVKTMTEKNGGHLLIASKKGEGTSISIQFPLVTG